MLYYRDQDDVNRVVGRAFCVAEMKVGIPAVVILAPPRFLPLPQQLWLKSPFKMLAASRSNRLADARQDKMLSEVASKARK